MSQAFHLEVDSEGFATLTFDLPGKSANIFTREALTELQETVQELAGRSDIRCLVLLSAKPRIFIAGADVEEITHVTDPAEAADGARAGQALFNTWAALPFPTVAAIRGTCLGGGTELALASDHIVTSDRADIRIGLPEIKLGILPGWGGCARLPRRVGIMNALDIILAGKAVVPRKAFKIGLADALVPDASFLHVVRQFAVARMGQSGKRSKKSDLRTALLEKNPVGRRILFDQARKKTLAQTGGHYPAPLRAIEVIRTGVDKGLEAGLDAEARAIGELAVSPVCKSLLHVFHLMETAKGNGHPAGQAKEIDQVAVLGAGVMGGGIAQLVSAKAGLPVDMKDIALEPIGSGLAHASALFGKMVKRRRLRKSEAKEKMALIRGTLDYSGFQQTDLVIEAVVENMGIKQKVFAEVAAATRPDTILASNTSTLSIDGIGKDTPHPERVVGMHFFNPVHKMPLVEVIAGESTGDDAVQTIIDFSRRLGKTPVVVRNRPGFLVNRLLGFYMSESLWLIDEGFKIDDVDRVMKSWGMPMGPLTLTDEVGIDVASKASHVLLEAFPDRLEVPAWADRVAESGRLGAKNQKGYYLYENGKRKGPDPAVYELLGLQPTKPADAGYITDRLLLPMVNEAARCLEEKVVAGPGELDLAMIFGTGFPPFRGGLCRWVDVTGPTEMLATMERLAETVGSRYTPSDAFRQVVEAGGFYKAY